MKRIIFALLISLGVISAQAQDDMGPSVNINALEIGTGTITSYLDSMYGQEASCVNLEAMDMDEDDMDEASTSSFACLLQLVIEAGLADTLASDGPFTVFAPTNTAFQNFLNDSEDFNAFTDFSADMDVLTAVLMHHVIPMEMSLNDMYFSAQSDVNQQVTLETAGGSEITLTFPFDDTAEEGVVELGDGTLPQAYVSSRTIDLDNGYIIPINDVLVPPMQ